MSIYVFGQATNNVDHMQIYIEDVGKDIVSHQIFIFGNTRAKANKYVEAGIDAEQLVRMYQYFTENQILKLLRKTEKTG